MNRMLIAMIFAAPMLGGCGPGGLSGQNYGGDGCLMFPKISFKDNNTAYVTNMLGMEQVMKYQVDGDKVALMGGEEAGLVFTRTADALEMNMLGQTMRCKRL